MAPEIKKHYIAISIVALSGILYGFLGYAGTHLMQLHFSVNTMLFWRFTIATIYILIVGLYTYKKNLFKSTPWRIQFYAFLSGFLFYSTSSAFFFMVSRYIGTGLAMVLFSVFPIFIVLFEWFFNNLKLSFNTALSLIAMIIGLYLIASGKTFHLNAFGIFLAILSALAYALYIFSSKQIANKINSTVLTINVCFGCVAAYLCVSLFNQDFSWPNSSAEWFYVIFIGLICTAIPIQMLFAGLKTILASQAAIISVLEPITMVIVGMIALHEPLTMLQLLGVFIILFGALSIQLISLRKSSLLQANNVGWAKRVCNEPGFTND